MIRILLFLGLASSVWTLVLKRTATVFEAKEDDNITIRLNSQLQADVSLADMMCVFHSDVTKILFKMIRGVEDSESQHEQFAGRVQTDRDALRGGRIRLHLSRVTAEDSGSYRCNVAADYDDSLKRWRLETNENFVLSVDRTSDGDSSDVSLKPPMFGPPKDPQLAGRKTSQEETVLFVLAVVLIIANAGTIVLLIKFLHDGLKRSTT
ncbi:uncharacterized protein LOC102799914 [Neolamprologus brichardi]|uniref:uncharacterized protein LOC102799914 n=1 Tax=Neolamprologus brichardi TaxID=32507 RepID=UPI0016436FF1|nr:uncharacterized protein LOC102799914 [Neolamprologus brichardi]